MLNSKEEDPSGIEHFVFMRFSIEFELFLASSLVVNELGIIGQNQFKKKGKKQNL
jgi:hypothetical protein